MALAEKLELVDSMTRKEHGVAAMLMHEKGIGLAKELAAFASRKIPIFFGLLLENVLKGIILTCGH